MSNGNILFNPFIFIDQHFVFFLNNTVIFFIIIYIFVSDNSVCILYAYNK